MGACKSLVLFALLTLDKFKFISTAANAANLQKNAKSLSISSDYATLRNDAQWFFQHLELLADSLVQILPTAGDAKTAGTSAASERRSLTTSADNGTFVENTRLTLLLGLRHVLVGIKEISIAFQQKFTGDQAQQLQQLKAISNLLQDAIRVAKNWFSLLRSSLSELFRIYNHYIPEVLLGKCLGRYITNEYPDRLFYEYPWLLIGEMFEYIVDYIQSMPFPEATTAVQHVTYHAEEEEPSVEQNEIWPTGQAHDKFASTLPVKQEQQQEETLEPELVLRSNAKVNRTHAWQKCLKIYAADTISRQLKNFFLDDDD